MADEYFGENPITTTVSASPSPTSTVFTVGSAVDLRQNQYINVQISGNYERKKISSISSNQITLAEALSTAPSAGANVISSRELISVPKINGGMVYTCTDLDDLKTVDTTYAKEGLKYSTTQLGGFKLALSKTQQEGGGYAVEPTTGSGVWEPALAHPDAIMATLSNDIFEILPPVTAVINFGSISSGSNDTEDVTVSGAEDGDIVILQHPSNLNARLYYRGSVPSDNTVRITLFNESGGSIDPDEGTWTVLVIKPNLMPAMTQNALRLFSNLLGGVFDASTLEADLGEAENEAAFRILINSTWRRKMLLDDSSIKTIIQNSATADAAMEDVEGAGY